MCSQHIKYPEQEIDYEKVRILGYHPKSNINSIHRKCSFIDKLHILQYETQTKRMPRW